MSEYQKGIEHYRNGGKIQQQQTFHIDFISGYHFEERISRCGFSYQSWHKAVSYIKL